MGIIERFKAKLPFIYEVEGILYAIGTNSVVIFDCRNMTRDYAGMFKYYKENLRKIKDNEGINKEEFSDILYRLITRANMQLSCSLTKNCSITIEEFYNNMSAENKIDLENQLNDFRTVYENLKMSTRYPGLSKIAL